MKLWCPLSQIYDQPDCWFDPNPIVFFWGKYDVKSNFYLYLSQPGWWDALHWFWRDVCFLLPPNSSSSPVFPHFLFLVAKKQLLIESTISSSLSSIISHFQQSFSGPTSKHIKGRSGPRVGHLFLSERSGTHARHLFPSENFFSKKYSKISKKSFRKK